MALANCLTLAITIRAGADQITAQINVPHPGAKDLCPVCGMIASKYPNWTATVPWKDGHAAHSCNSSL